MNATDWERTAERDPDHQARMTAHDRAAAAMARDVPAASQAGFCKQCQAGDHSYHVVSLGGICIGCACPGEMGDDDE